MENERDVFSLEHNSLIAAFSYGALMRKMRALAVIHEKGSMLLPLRTKVESWGLNFPA